MTPESQTTPTPERKRPAILTSEYWQGDATAAGHTRREMAMYIALVVGSLGVGVADATVNGIDGKGRKNAPAASPAINPPEVSSDTDRPDDKNVRKHTDASVLE